MQKPHEQSQHTGSSQGRGSYAEWIALGAVAAGSVGAIVGMAHRWRSASRNSAMPAFDADPGTLTAPHGDKLKGAIV